MDPYQGASDIEQEAMSEHEFKSIWIGEKQFCPNTLERIASEEDWEEMSEYELEIAQREYLVKVGKKYEIRLKGEELKV